MIKIESVATVSLIVNDASRNDVLFIDTLALPMENYDGYLMTEKLPGVRHLGMWPISQAAATCFGSSEWPADVTKPQASIEFEVASPDDVFAAAAELRRRGYSLLHDAKVEPWGQTITRLLGENGLIVGICYTPSFHENSSAHGGASTSSA